MKLVVRFAWLFLAIYSLPLAIAISNKDYTSYRRYPLCRPSDDIRYPKSTADVVDIVKEASDRGIKVKAFGSRHSLTDVICTEGIPVDMRGINSCKMNADKVTATFGAGILMADLGEFLRRNGRALRTIPAFGGITLGGAIGTGAHGSTIKYNATISSQVIKMTVVDGNGNVLEISDPIDLRSFKVNLGLLGVIVDITLYTVPLYKVLAHNYVTSDVVLTNGVAANWAQTADQITIYWYPDFNEVVVSNLTFVPVESRGTGRFRPAICPIDDRLNLIGTLRELVMNLISNGCAAASTLGHTIMEAIGFLIELSLWTKVPGPPPIYTEDGSSIRNPAVGFAHSMLSVNCSEDSNDISKENLNFMDNEFSIALSDLELFVAAVKDIVKKTPTLFPLYGINFRVSGKDNNYMSTSYGRDSVHPEFFFLKRKDPYNDASSGIAGYQTIVQTLARRFKGRSHWGKSGLIYHGSDMLDLKLDPEARWKFIDGINSDVESTMGLVEPTASSIKPDYGITNVTTQIGTSAYLPCKVKQIFNKSVSWVRVRDHHILTVDRTTFIADERFHSYYSSTGQLPGVWTLQIKYVQARDAGMYECHGNFYGDEQKTSARVRLNVVVPRTELIGDTNRYVKEGSKVTLHCIVSGALDPPLYIFWFHGNEQIYPDNRRSWKTEINRNSLESDHTQSTIGSLTIPSVKKKDSGNYTCSPSNSDSISIMLHVINGEYSASAITSSSTTRMLSGYLGALCVILMVFQT